LREKISSLEHVKYLEVSPYGATAMSSIRANVDTLLGSEDIASLPKVAKDVESALAKTKGVVSTSVTWDMDKVVYELDIDRSKALQYGLSSRDIVSRIGMMLRGVPVATFPKKNSTDYTVRVWMPSKDIDDISSILSLLIDTKKGKVPLSYFATIVPVKEPGLITREGLKYTIEVYGSREKAAISHIMADYREHLQEVSLPSNVDMEQIGDENQFKSSAGRMVRGVATAVGLIFLTLIVMFGDLKISAIVVLSIPLTIIGASWTLLYMGYHVSMPAMMGFILLSGIIVNNAILLIHFALTRIAEGIPKKDAMLESIRIRTRPVLMTAFSVSAGMLPVAQGAAIGLERLAPLGAVAIGGLIVGTLMTLVFIPVIFIWSVNEKRVVENMTP
jgi:multidrug efflux pump subunit AcrB